MNIVETVEKDYLKADVPTLRSGDTVRVHVKVVEGTRERIQVFEGVVIALTKSGLKENFTVRRVTHGVGVERTFMVHSPRIDKIEVVRHGDAIREVSQAHVVDHEVPADRHVRSGQPVDVAVVLGLKVVAPNDPSVPPDRPGKRPAKPRPPPPN